MSEVADHGPGGPPERLSAPALVAAVASVYFIVIAIWWLLADNRLPGGGDPGRHLSTTLAYADLLGSGDLLGMIKLEGDPPGFFYPPLARFVGAIPAAFGLGAEDWGVIALNLVFVPLLAAGCYGVGKLVYGPRAGALAAVFALVTPMVLSMFHVFLLDAPLAAMVAVSLWALLASDRFRRRRESVIAGLLIGAAIMVKTPAPLFLAGPVAVMLIAGGWRQWRNLALAALAIAVVALPYHLVHLDVLTGVSEQAAGPGTFAYAPSYSRLSLENLAWYGWAGLNIQYLAPLAALFVIGAVSAVREIRSRRHLPEIMAGLVVSYLGATLLVSIRDPRYTLPMVVFVAVIATGWIVTTNLRWARIAGIAVLVVGATANVATSLSDGLPTVRINEQTEPGGDIVEPGAITLLDDRGYVVGAARPDDRWTRLLERAERDGVESARIRVREAPLWGSDELAFDVAAQQHDIRTASFSDEPPRMPELLIDTWYQPDSYWVDERGLPPPCFRIGEGTDAPGGSNPVAVAVSVRRLGPDGYERWCQF